MEESADYPEIEAPDDYPAEFAEPSIDISEPVPVGVEGSKPDPNRPTKAVRPIKIESFKYEYPSIDLLAANPSPGASVNRDELQMTARSRPCS